MKLGWRVPAMLLAVFLVGCSSSGVPRRISEPAASLQQLTVEADGRWSIELRLQNYSSIPMRFEAVSLALTVEEQAAGTLAAHPPAIRGGFDLDQFANHGPTPSRKRCPGWFGILRPDPRPCSAILRCALPGRRQACATGHAFAVRRAPVGV